MEYCNRTLTYDVMHHIISSIELEVGRTITKKKLEEASKMVDDAED